MTINAQLIPNPIQQFFDSNGAPLAGGKLFSYAAGTSTPKPTFTDASGSIQNPNPIILDSEGRCEVWMDNGGYKFSLQDSLSNPQWTVDNVFIIPPGFVGATQIAAGAVGTTQLANLAVTTAKLADNSVTTAKIPDNAVTTSKLPNGAVTAPKIDPNLDVSQLNRNIEQLFSNQNEQVGWKGAPQFQWSNPVKLANPDVNPTGVGTYVAWSPNEEFLACTNLTATPMIRVYQRLGTNFYGLVSSGTLPPSVGGNGCAWSPDGQFLSIGHSVSPFISVMQKQGWNIQRLASPGTLPGGAVNGVAWSKDGGYLALACAASPFLIVYARLSNNGVAYQKLTDPATLPPSGAGTKVAWTSDGQYVAVGGPGSPGFSTYLLTPGTAGNGVPVLTYQGAAPSPPINVTDLAFSPDRQILACALSSSPFLALYSFSGGVFTPIALPSTLPNSNAFSVAWSANSAYLALGSQDSGSNKLIVYSRSGTSFMALAVPANPPNTAVNGLAWSPTGQFLAVATAGSPFVNVYQTASLTFNADSTAWVRQYVGD